MKKSSYAVVLLLLLFSRLLTAQDVTLSRDHEYVRHGTVTLMAGIDLLSGKVHGIVVDRHRSREFIAFLRELDRSYPPVAINRSALIPLTFPTTALDTLSHGPDAPSAPLPSPDRRTPAV